MGSMTDKVQKLLAKAANEATPEAEREMCLAKAAKFISEYNIDAALLAAKAEVHVKATHKIVYVSNPFSTAKVDLLAIIAQSFNCRSILEKNSARNDGLAICRVFGFENEIESTELLFASALTVGMMKAERRRREGHTSRGYQSSYWLGFRRGINTQLTESVKEAATEAENKQAGTALVLSDRRQEVTALVNSTYSDLRTIKRSYSSSDGYNTGHSDGRTANIRGRNNISNNRRALS